MSLAPPALPPTAALAPISPPALTPFPFRTLPSEVRNLIYTLLFDKNAHLDSSTATGSYAANPQILSTCHQVNHEATRLLYSASMAQVVVRKEGVEVRSGLQMEMEARDGGRAGGAGEGDGDGKGVGEERGKGNGRTREHLKSLRRFEVFAVKIIDDTTTSEERTQLLHAVADLCAVLAEDRYLRRISVDVQIADREQDARKQEEEEEKRLLEPFRTLKAARDVQFSGAIKNGAFVAGLRQEMMRVDGEEEGEEEMDLAAWEDVEGSAM